MRETEAEALLIAKIKQHEPHSHWFKSEDRQRSGVWDQGYCIRGKEGWIEFKICRDKSKLITLKPKQYQWGREGLKSGRRMFLALFNLTDPEAKIYVIPGDLIRHKTLRTYGEWYIAAAVAGTHYDYETVNINKLVSQLRGEV